MDLRNALHEAVAETPPSRIQLDVLIGREQRRETRQRWLTGAATVAAVAMVATVAAFGAPGGDGSSVAGPPAGPGPGCVGWTPGPAGSSGASTPGVGGPGGVTSSGSPAPVVVTPSPAGSAEPVGPQPREECAAAIPRLTNALGDAVRTALPSVRLGEISVFRVDTGSYVGVAEIQDGDWRGTRLQVSISTHGGAPTAEEQCSVANVDCKREVAADGTVIFVARYQVAKRNQEPSPAPTHGPLAVVDVFRPDGTHLTLVHTGRHLVAPASGASASPEFGSTPPLSPAQLVAIARAPGLTLFP